MRLRVQSSGFYVSVDQKWDGLNRLVHFFESPCVYTFVCMCAGMCTYYQPIGNFKTETWIPLCGVTTIHPVIYFRALFAVSLLEKAEFGNTGLTEGVRTVEGVPTTAASFSLEVTCLPAYVREGFASTVRSQWQNTWSPAAEPHWEALKGSQKQQRIESFRELQRSHSYAKEGLSTFRVGSFYLMRFPSSSLVGKPWGHPVGVRALMPTGQGR